MGTQNSPALYVSKHTVQSKTHLNYLHTGSSLRGLFLFSSGETIGLKGREKAHEGIHYESLRA